jgi:hypothetical protein
VRDLRALLRHRASLVRLTTSLKNRVHAVLADRGGWVEQRLWSQAGRAWLWPRWSCHQPSGRLTWDAKPLERAFTQQRSPAGETLLCVAQGRPRPAMTRRSRGSDLIQRRGKADAVRCQPTPASGAKRYDSLAMQA